MVTNHSGKSQEALKPASGIGNWLFRACLLMMLGSAPLMAEEQTSEVNPDSTIFSFSLSSHRAPMHLLAAPEKQDFHIGELFRAEEDWHLESARRGPGRINLEDDSPVSLFRKSMPTRHSYLACANLGGGWGQIFESDHLGRSRTNGAGVQDADFFYLKMSLRF